MCGLNNESWYVRELSAPKAKQQPCLWNKVEIRWRVGPPKNITQELFCQTCLMVCEWSGLGEQGEQCLGLDGVVTANKWEKSGHRQIKEEQETSHQ